MVTLSLHPPRASAEHLPPEHGDFVLDAGLLPLQRLFGDALDGDHLPRGLLPRHHHFGERAAARHTGRKLLSYAAPAGVDTDKPYRRRADGGHSQADGPEYTNNILGIFTENWQGPPSPLFHPLATGDGLLCWLTPGARVQPKARQTLLIPLQKHPLHTHHLGRRIACPPLTICLRT